VGLGEFVGLLVTVNVGVPVRVYVGVNVQDGVHVGVTVGVTVEDGQKSINVTVEYATGEPGGYSAWTLLCQV
jgi:3-deoxy-D-manno-octulosonate 8-phosphate phosphatase KdsC-like HAD superfamily phosphatase